MSDTSIPEYELPLSLRGEPWTVIQTYIRLLDSGESPRMAEMFATRRAAGIQTDSTYFAGTKRIGDVWGDEHTRLIVKDARKHGYNPGANDVYNPTAARFRGDPEAFVKHCDGRETIKKLAERRGIESEELGTKSDMRNVKRLARQRRDVAPDIIRNEIHTRLKNNDIARPGDMIETALKQKTIRKKKRI